MDEETISIKVEVGIVEHRGMAAAWLIARRRAPGHAHCEVVRHGWQRAGVRLALH